MNRIIDRVLGRIFAGPTATSASAVKCRTTSWVVRWRTPSIPLQQVWLPPSPPQRQRLVKFQKKSPAEIPRKWTVSEVVPTSPQWLRERRTMRVRLPPRWITFSTKSCMPYCDNWRAGRIWRRIGTIWFSFWRRRLVDFLWTISYSVDQLIVWSIHWSIDWLIHSLIDWLIDWLIVCSFHRWQTRWNHPSKRTTTIWIYGSMCTLKRYRMERPRIALSSLEWFAPSMSHIGKCGKVSSIRKFCFTAPHWSSSRRKTDSVHWSRSCRFIFLFEKKYKTSC